MKIKQKWHLPMLRAGMAYFFSTVMLCSLLIPQLANSEITDSKILKTRTASDAAKVVTGKVTSAEDGLPLPGVTVTIKGTTIGELTDTDGNYRISIPDDNALTDNNTVLVYRYLGFVTQEVTVGNQTVINVIMETDVVNMGELVVTALNIERSTKTLPFASQQITSDKLNIAQQQNVTNALTGKVAGVQVRTVAGTRLGENASVRIRGNVSLTGDGGALWVVDGTPGINPSSINMDDVETMNVLKGPNATALYGQRAENGVIMITTKRGSRNRGLGIEFTSGITVEEVGRLPKYQNIYGGGGTDWITYNWNPNHPVEWQVFDGKKYHDYSDDASWGPKMDGSEYIPWYAWYPGSDYSFKTANFNPQPNNIRDFWETGTTLRNNVSFSKGSDDFAMRVSYTNEAQKGLLPNSSLDKNYISAKLDFDLSDKFSVGLNANYQDQELNGSFGDGYSNNATGNFNQWFHRDLDINIMRELKDFRTPTGNLASWNHTNVGTTTNFSNQNFNRGYYWFNPYAYFENIDYTSYNNRVFGDLSLKYKINDKISLTGNVRKYEVYGRSENKTPYILETSGFQAGYFNGYSTGQSRYSESNYDFLAMYSDSFGDFAVDANIGANLRRTLNSSISGGTSGGLIVPDLWSIANSKTPTTTSHGYSLKETRSVFARATLGYKELLFLEATIRNDVSSALPKGNNGYIYPSFGGSFVFSDLLTDLPFLSFGKLRAGYAETGNDLSAYQLNSTFGISSAQFNGNLLMSTPNQLISPNINPVTNSSWEVGADFKFFERRAGLSVTYYKEKHKDDILSAQISSASGYTSVLQNAGSTQRSGLEIALDGTPIRTSNLEWNITVNWAKNKSEVISIAENLQTLQAGAGTFGFVRVIHKEGEQWGQLRGTAIKRDANGNAILDSDGLYIAEQDQYFGTVLPDFNGGIISSLTWKDLTLNISIDYQKGGKFFSLSEMWGSFSGLFEETAATNDNGMNVRDAVEDDGGVHVTGVDENGNAVDMYVPAFDYYHQFYFRNRMAEPFIHDASYIKMREISLSYRIPVNQILNNSPFQGIQASFIARNPWLISTAKGNKHWDTSDMSQNYGENGQLPSTRSYGLSLKFTF